MGMRIKTFPVSLETLALLSTFLICIIASPTSGGSSSILRPDDSHPQWSYSRVKRQLFREDIPHHRPLSGNIYATHHGFPHPGRWHPRPQSILPPNPVSGHHFDDPNVIITDDDFNRYGSTLQHLDNQIQHESIPHTLPLHHQHPPPIPDYGSGPVLRHVPKRRPVKVLVHGHQTIHSKPIVHSYPVEYGKLVPIGEVGGNVITTIGEGPGIDGPVLPIIAAHHHQHHQEPHQPLSLSYAQEYKHVAAEHAQNEPLFPPLKVKHLFRRLKFPPGFGSKLGGGVEVSGLRYGVHDGRGKNGAFAWSIAY